VNHRPTRLCIAAPDVDRKEPIMTTQGVGQAICAIINPPPMLSPNLQQSVQMATIWLVTKSMHFNTEKMLLVSHRWQFTLWCNAQWPHLPVMAF